jgi:hypothetical protein
MKARIHPAEPGGRIGHPVDADPKLNRSAEFD